MELWKKEWKGELFASLGSASSCGSIILFKSGNNFTFSNFQSDLQGRIVCCSIDGPGWHAKLLGVYAPNIPSQRRNFFHNLSNYLNDRGPFILAGDFNCVLDSSLDRMGSPSSSPDIGSRELQLLCDDLFLFDPWRASHPDLHDFTWRNASNSIRSRLDRFYISNSISFSSVDHLPVFFSDHDGVVLTFKPDNLPDRGRGFWKCNTSVLSDPLFQTDFSSAYVGWRTLRDGFADLLDWWEDVKFRSKKLIIFHSCRLAKLRDKEKHNLMSSLARITSLLNSGSTDHNLLADLQSIKQQLSDLEDFLAAGAQVRSRVQRLNDGERPSSFFFPDRIQ